MNTERDKFLTEAMGECEKCGDTCPFSCQDFSTWNGFGKLVESKNIRLEVGAHFYRILGEIFSESFDNIPDRFADAVYAFLKEAA